MYGQFTLNKHNIVYLLCQSINIDIDIDIDIIQILKTTVTNVLNRLVSKISNFNILKKKKHFSTRPYTLHDTSLCGYEISPCSDLTSSMRMKYGKNIL